jgi:hypothetical protein
MTTLENKLRARSLRGHPRGSTGVFAAATSQIAEEGARPQLAIASRVAIFGSLTTAAVVAVVLLASVPESTRAIDTSDTPAETTGVPGTPAGPSESNVVDPVPGTPTVSSPTTAVDRSAPRLDEVYDQCVKMAGFDPQGVQVILDDTGTGPWWVKTGFDVPAEIHRPCFEAIGGSDPSRSSHGTRTILASCAGPEQPGDIPQPPLANSPDPALAIHQSATTTTAGQQINLSWAAAGEVIHPVDSLVECWTGASWVPGFTVHDMPARAGASSARELETDTPLSNDESAYTDGTILVHPLAPAATYRLTGHATICATGVCNQATYEVRFKVVS